MDVFDAPIRPQIVAASRQIPKLVATPGSKKKRPSGRVRRAPFCQRGWLIEQGSFLCFRHRSLFPNDIDFMAGKLHVRRAKGGTTGVHPVGGRELRPAEAKV